MAKVLTTNELLEAAKDTLDETTYENLAEKIERAHSAMAEAVAAKLDIECSDTSIQLGFGGLCSTFKPKYDAQECPEAIDDGDPDGDWE